MKFLIEFSGNNLLKFRSFIRMCNQVFTKSGIIVTLVKDSKIRVAPDPYNISDQFNYYSCATDSIDIYKYSIFIEYPLRQWDENSQKNSTFNKLELKTTKPKNQDANLDNVDNVDKVLTFRMTLEQLKILNKLLQESFINSESITLKAEKITESFEIKFEAKNYKGACLTISNNEKNSKKSVILFKPLRRPYKIEDYEDDFEMEDDENKILGKFIFSRTISTKKLKKFVIMAQKNSNKIINLYSYKENDKEEKSIKSYLFISYLCYFIYLGKYIINENINPEEFKNIYKIQISSEKLTKILKNFNGDSYNPDFISVWSKGIVFKKNYKLRYNFEDKEKNIEENNFQNSQNEDENFEEDIDFMTVKAFIIFEKNTEIINFEGINIDNGYEKKQYIIKLIKNDVDDKHEELNKSLDLSDIDDGVIFRRNNSLMDEDEDEDEDNIDNIEIINKKTEEKKKKKSSIKIKNK